jgi:hypothetical protein
VTGKNVGSHDCVLQLDHHLVRYFRMANDEVEDYPTGSRIALRKASLADRSVRLLASHEIRASAFL